MKHALHYGPAPRRPSWRRNVDTLGLILSVSFLFSITSHEHPSETGLRAFMSPRVFSLASCLITLRRGVRRGENPSPARFSLDLRHAIPLSPSSSLSVEYLGGSHNINTKQGLMLSGPSAGEPHHAHQKGLSGLVFLSRSVCAGNIWWRIFLLLFFVVYSTTFCRCCQLSQLISNILKFIYDSARYLFSLLLVFRLQLLNR